MDELTNFPPYKVLVRVDDAGRASKSVIRS